MTAFVGRRAELDALRDWVAADLPEEGRAGVVIGAPGRGKTELLKALRRECQERPTNGGRWYVEFVPIAGQQSASEAMEQTLGHVYQQVSRLVGRGPHDRAALRALLGEIPGIGRLLSHFVRHDTRPGWQRFLDFAGALDRSVSGAKSRFVFLIDPQDELGPAPPGDWIPLARGLPGSVRLIVAQRPDDVLVVDENGCRAFTRLLGAPLGDLPREAVRDLYRAEFARGRLEGLAADERDVWTAAYRRYGGYPLAHRAVLTSILFERATPQNVAQVIRELPSEVEDLLDLLYRKLYHLGLPAQLAALTLQVFGAPTPYQPWASASGVDPLELSRLLEDPRFLSLVELVDAPFGRAYRPFHGLFAERLERALEENDQRRRLLAESAWKVVGPQLEADSQPCECDLTFSLTVAVNLARRCNDAQRLLLAAERTFPLKLRAGMLDEAAADMELLLGLFPNSRTITAAASGNLATVMRTRGDLEEAEELYRVSARLGEEDERWGSVATSYANLGIVRGMLGDYTQAESLFRRSLQISEDLGEWKGVAVAYGNLGIIMKSRGDLDGAETMYRKSLEIERQHDHLEGMISDYGNLGNVLRLRGDLDGAEEMHRQSLEISSSIGSQGGIANAHSSLGIIAMEREELDQAEEMLRMALDIYQRIGSMPGLANTYTSLGNLCTSRGDLCGAERMHLQALQINEEIGAIEGVAYSHMNLGHLLCARGDTAGALQSWEDARALFSRLGAEQMVALTEEWINDLLEDVP